MVSGEFERETGKPYHDHAPVQHARLHVLVKNYKFSPTVAEY